MTIEEHIEGLRLSLVQQSWSCNTPIGMANKKHDEELLELLEELIVLRKAYALACDTIGYGDEQKKEVKEYYLRIAKEELQNAD